MALISRIFALLRRAVAPGRPDEPADHDRLYNQAADLVSPRIALDSRPLHPLTSRDRQALERGMAFFERVLQLNPTNWPAMWYTGKAYQRLGDTSASLLWFARANQVHPGHPDVAREAALAAMDLGRSKDAIRFCEQAIASNPDDPGLRANLALALLFSEEVEHAVEVADDAVSRNPSDEITQRVAALCREVKSGHRKCPHHVRDIR